MIFKLSTYVETQIPWYQELLKETFEEMVLVVLKENEEHLRTMFASEFQKLIDDLNPKSKETRKVNGQSLLKFLTKGEVLEQMRTKK